MILIILLIICLSGLALTNLIEMLTDWIELKKGLKVQEDNYIQIPIEEAEENKKAIEEKNLKKF